MGGPSSACVPTKHTALANCKRRPIEELKSRYEDSNTKSPQDLLLRIDYARTSIGSCLWFESYHASPMQRNTLYATILLFSHPSVFVQPSCDYLKVRVLRSLIYPSLLSNPPLVAHPKFHRPLSSMLLLKWEWSTRSSQQASRVPFIQLQIHTSYQAPMQHDRCLQLFERLKSNTTQRPNPSDVDPRLFQLWIGRRRMEVVTRSKLWRILRPLKSPLPFYPPSTF